jgi:hypothetical protein
VTELEDRIDGHSHPEHVHSPVGDDAWEGIDFAI